MTLTSTTKAIAVLFAVPFLATGVISTPSLDSGLDAAMNAAISFDSRVCQHCYAIGNSSSPPSDEPGSGGAHHFSFTSYSQEVLYQLQLHRPTLVNISTCENTFNTVIYLYSSENITANSLPLFINDDLHFDLRASRAARPGCHQTASFMSVRLPAGHFVIAIEGFAGEHGAFDLRVDMREEPRSLEEALDAAPVTTVGAHPGEGSTTHANGNTTTFHGNTSMGQHHLSRTSDEAREVIYRLDLQAQHQVNISTCENEVDTVLYVFSADDWTAVADARPLFLNDDLTIDLRANLAARPGCHRSSSFLSLDLAPGSYWVVVEGFDEHHGAFDLTFDWQRSTPETLADALAFAPRFGPSHSAATHFDSRSPASTITDMVWWAGYAGDTVRGSQFLASALLAGRDAHDDAQNDTNDSGNDDTGGTANAAIGGMELYRLDLDHPDVPHYELNLRTCESPEVDVVLMIYDGATIDQPGSSPMYVSNNHAGEAGSSSCSKTSSFLSASLAPGVYYAIVVGASTGGAGVYDLVIDARLGATGVPETQPGTNEVDLDLDLGSGSGSGPDEDNSADYPVTTRTQAMTTVGADNTESTIPPTADTTAWAARGSTLQTAADESTIPTVATTVQAARVSTLQTAAGDGTSTSGDADSTGIPGGDSSSSSAGAHDRAADSHFMLAGILILGVALIASGAVIKHRTRASKQFQEKAHWEGTHNFTGRPAIVNPMYTSVATMKIQRVADIDICETGPGFSNCPNRDDTAANHSGTKPDHVSLLVPDEGHSSA